MPTPAIDFRCIRPHHGSQHGGFEELVCQLAALETPTTAPFFRKGAGADAGLECYRVGVDGSETGWQAKYFFALGSSEAAQLKKSFENAAEKHPKLSRFVVCLPFDLSDGRVGRAKSEKDRWNDWVEAQRKAVHPRIIDIELWGAFELTERLSRTTPPYVGRRTYWFDLPHFGPEWFARRFQISRASLGRRYTPELNIELPIRKGLMSLARDSSFVGDVNDWADQLDEAAHRSVGQMAAPLGDEHATEAANLGVSVVALTSAIRAAAIGPADTLPLDHWRQLCAAAETALDRCSRLVWDLRIATTGTKETVRHASYFVEHLREALDSVCQAISAPETALANATRLLVSGEAGVGKSHLLADVAEKHIAQGSPAVLVLGGSFADDDPWRQIVEQLGLGGITPDALLGALDAAAEAAGTRAIVMVDAINERNGVAVWSDRLAAFLTTADRFPRVAVVVSCRTTFIPYIVRDLDHAALPRIDHPGFAGRAAEAARRYLDERGIVRMAAPNLAPEFENPLFLRTCCDMLEARGERELPRGLAGVSSVFDFYFGAVVEAINRRMGLFPRLGRVEAALRVLTEAMVERGAGYLSLEEANAMLETVHPSGGAAEQSLFLHLESEGVIAVEPVSDSSGLTEMVRFTFERMSDHRIAQRLLSEHVGSTSPTAAFAKDGPLARYVAGRGSHRFAGIAEAFAVQLPELCGVELIDAIEDEFARWDLVHGFGVSLLWRRQEFFTDRTLELVEELDDALGGEAVLGTLIAIATEPTNRFNADHLHRWLGPLTMPERDVAWSTRVTILVEHGENAVDTLIHWVLANGLDAIEAERARLAAMTLAWLTSVSHRWVRDMATKALATLLVERRALASDLIRQFAAVDDAYVVDRVLAAAYGAAMRSASNAGLADLARAAFDSVFARDPVPTHALIRDHARGIVELAAARGVLPDNIPLDRARPPYAPGAPLEIITKEMLADYVEDYGRGQFRDEICSSAVEDGDFARYEIDPLADHFLLLPHEDFGRSIEEIYEEWRAQAITPRPERAEALARIVTISATLHTMPHGFDFKAGRSRGEDVAERRRAVEAERDAAYSALEALLDPDEQHEFRIRAAGYLRGRMWDDRASAWHPTHSGGRARRWVAWRAHELGWTPERFSDFDRMHSSGGRNEHRIERIGKKYQWIALHELTGRLADRSLCDGGFRDEPGLYRGPWQVGTREMDPSVLVTRTEQRDSSRQGATWWSPYAPRWGRDAPEARITWMEDQTRDLPDPAAQIDVIDSEGRRWLVLDTNVGRNQWVMVEGEKVIQRMTWHKVKSLLVPRHAANRLARSLAVSERERDHPREIDLPYHSYLGEYPWHPSFAETSDDDEGSATDPGGEPTIADRRIERSGHDYSIEDSFDLTLPAPAIIRGLGLRLADGSSLAYADGQGRILFKDPSVEEAGFSSAVVHRDALLDYLSSEGLEVVWIITGEKSAHGGRRHGNGWGGMLEYWGIYRLSGNTLVGSLSFVHKAPRPAQLEEFLAHP